jgi:hypothetical protein
LGSPTNHVSGAATEKLSINNVPNDIIHLIVDQLTIPGLVCLGWTNKKFYEFLTRRYPDLPCLLEPVRCIITDEGENQECTPSCPYLSLKLKDLLCNWSGIGPGYWFLYEYPSIFLNGIIYAPPGWGGRRDRDGVARLQNLIDRYHDYATINRDWASRPMTEGQQLPKPHNMGDDLYTAAFEIIGDDKIH